MRAPWGAKTVPKPIMRRFAAVLGGVLVACATVQAEPVADFYQGKTVTVVASTGAGGPLDLIARTVAKHIGRHIPGNPGMIVRNMPGGGHVLATNFMYNQAPKDGTTIATVVNSIPLHQVIDGRGVRYDARRFGWIGGLGTSNLMTVAWHTVGVRTIDDVMRRELPTGATGVGSGTFVYTNAMNVVLGTKFKMVLGYASSTDIDLAIERGEVQARGGFSLSGIKQERPYWIAEKKVVMLAQVGGEREPEYPDVPLMHELAKTTEQRQISGVAVIAGGARPAVLRAARHSGRSARRAARCIRRAAAGRAVPRRGAAVALRPQRHERGTAGRDRQRHGERAGRRGRQGEGRAGAARRGEVGAVAAKATSAMVGTRQARAASPPLPAGERSPHESAAGEGVRFSRWSGTPSPQPSPQREEGAHRVRGASQRTHATALPAVLRLVLVDQLEQLRRRHRQRLRPHADALADRVGDRRHGRHHRHLADAAQPVGMASGSAPRRSRCRSSARRRRPACGSRGSSGSACRPSSP